MKSLFYAKKLIGFESVSDQSNRMISLYLERKLKKHGFETERVIYRDRNRQKKYNIIAKKGKGVGGLAYCCHTDVVPAKKWHSKKKGPFEPGVARERLYGRGACDMKGSIGCMLEAVQLIPESKLKQPIYFLCTADEEVGFEGAKRVALKSRFYREMVENQTCTIIGEPTLLEVVYSHKGSYIIRGIAKGVAAHSATREGTNANLKMIPFLNELKEIHDELESNSRWQNPLFDPPSMSWNIGINDHNSAINMTSAESECTIYFRPMPDVDFDPIIERVEKAAAANDVVLIKNCYGEPFMTDPESDFVKASLKLSRTRSARTVSYGTDAGAFTELERKIVLGPGSIAQAHTHNEWISIEQLLMGTQVYSKFVKNFCCEDLD